MATIKDVAKLAEVGVGTVSRCLSGNGGVSAKAQARITQAMAQLHYRPNSMARALSTRRSNIIGVWLPSLSGPFYHKILRSIEQELRSQGKHLILANAEGASSQEERLEHLNYLIHRDCDGVLMVCPEISDTALVYAQSQYPPLVFINHHVQALAGLSFSVDHYAGGRLAAAALLSLGHRKIACVSGRLSAQDANLRQQGFVDELLEQGRPIAPNLLIEGSFDYQQCAQAIQCLLNQSEAFDALFCGNDKIALVALSMLQAAGIKIPQQVSVVGYDDVDFAAYTTPTLSTVRIPIEEMARAACRQVLNQAYGFTVEITENLRPVFVARASTVAR